MRYAPRRIRTTFPLPLSLRGRRPWQSVFFPVPLGTGRCFASQGLRIATSGCALLAMTRKFSPGPSDDGAGAATPGGVALRTNLSVILRLWNCCHRRAVGLRPPPTMNGGAGDDRKGRPYAQRCEIGPVGNGPRAVPQNAPNGPPHPGESGPPSHYHCHSEGRSPVGISWKNPGNRTKYQEIATSLRSSQ